MTDVWMPIIIVIQKQFKFGNKKVMIQKITMINFKFDDQIQINSIEIKCYV